MSGFNSVESVTHSNISATTAAFVLRGGQYAVTITATWGGGTVTLQRLAADGTTWVAVTDAWTENTYETVNLPSGSYRLAVATSSAIYADITSVVVTL